MLSFPDEISLYAESSAVRAAVAAGKTSEALTLAAALQPNVRALAYALIAHSQAIRGDQADAQGTFALAKANVPVVTNDPSECVARMGPVAFIVEAEASAGLSEDSLVTLKDLMVGTRMSEQLELEQVAFLTSRTKNPDRVEAMFAQTSDIGSRCAIAFGAIEAILDK